MKDAPTAPKVGSDTRGAVYVEFLIAFMPLFLLFLAICQLALLASAKLVVQHAALASARSAIVVLEEAPDAYGGAPRGSLSEGSPMHGPRPEALLAALDLGDRGRGAPAGAGGFGRLLEQARGATTLQRGSRMVPIRTAAYLPLLPLAPTERAVGEVKGESLGASLPATFSSRVDFAIAFTRAAAVVSVHTDGTDGLASEPVDPRAPVTVRVTYLAFCGVPLARTLMCQKLAALISEEGSPLAGRWKLAEAPRGLETLASPGARFRVLSAEATLPNQGAAYYSREAD